MREWVLVIALVACGGDEASEAAGRASAAAADGGTGSTGATNDASGASGGAPDAATSSGTPADAGGFAYAFSAMPVPFDCNDAVADLLAKNVTHATVGTSTVFVGWEQVSGNDQDPIVARYDDGKKIFCEHSKKGGGIDGRAYGASWNGKDRLYVVYTIVGGGTAFDAAAKGAWLDAYGDGGGSAKASVLGIVDASTGTLTKATYVTSKVTKSGQVKTNTLTPADAVRVLADGSLELRGTPAYCTLNPDRSSMCDPNVKADYPKDYRARFTADLATMTCASATGVSVVKAPCP